MVIIDNIKIFIYRKIAKYYSNKSTPFVKNDYIKYMNLCMKCRKYEMKANYIVFKYW